MVKFLKTATNNYITMPQGCYPKFRIIALLAIIFTLVACGGSDTAKKEESDDAVNNIVFPPPPDSPRFYYEFTLFNSGQMLERTEEDSWREFLTGEKKSKMGEALGKPYDVSACGGKVYVSDTVRRHIAVFDFSNKNYFTIGTTHPGLLRKPLGLDTDAECNLYVADITLGSVMIYDAKGNFLNAIGGSDWFHRLSHVAVDPEGTRLYAVDTGGVQTEEHRVRVFNTQSGEHLFDFGHRGKEEGQFNLPKDIDMGPDGTLSVVDSGNFRVQIFDRDGKFLRAFGSIGNRTGQFSRPKGIATDPDGNVYVADTSLANFQIFDSQGQLLMFIGSRTRNSQPAGYMLPSGIDIDSDGRIFFTDQFFRKVDIFRPARLSPDNGAIGRVLHPETEN